MDNVRYLSNGLPPDKILEKAREHQPRFLIVSLVDENGNQITLHSDMSAAQLTFLVMSSHAQVSKFIAGG